ncbi:aminodeoxychorismate synthase, component I [Parazoarcus communis]|uniref:Aminodeoxychorismate synthase, component I n=1 Tax=Parazoarcus communis TaxID=41977 RepID=A0A2U8GW88_9RHOO|nr:aminodeoxychorismate synthase, component I [Parazoarcus communis]
MSDSADTRSAFRDIEEHPSPHTRHATSAARRNPVNGVLLAQHDRPFALEFHFHDAHLPRLDHDPPALRAPDHCPALRGSPQRSTLPRERLVHCSATCAGPPVTTPLSPDETANPGWALFDDSLPDGEHLWLTDLQYTLCCRSPGEVESTFGKIEAARRQGKWVAVAAAYELGYALEPRLQALLPADDAPLLRAWVFAKGERLSQAESLVRIEEELSLLDEHLQNAGVAALERGIERADYLEAIGRIRELIHAGDCYQVNFTWPLTGTIYGSPLALYRRLMEAQPVGHGGYIADADGAILSRSPELFVERSGKRLSCRPMKGTAPRSSDPNALASSTKDRAENVMIVDLIRNDLGRLAPAGGVKVESLCTIEPYPSVWQMTSSVHAEPVDADLITVFRALFPCGSVTGAPKIRAMEIIRELEREPRGLYCGALGWVAPDGDFSFNVPIRTLNVQPDGRFRLNLGSGVVADSDAESEWEECLLKGRFLTALGAPFGLIETLRCEVGAEPTFPLLEAHLSRLLRSSRHFGHNCDIGALRSALLAHGRTLTPGIHRVRLELSYAGRLVIAGQVLDAPPDTPPEIVQWPERVDSTDMLLRYKTTARETYDHALHDVLGRGYFDAVFLNERNEVTEGARSTVFIDTGDGILHTPPLSAGVLDGVLRRQLLEDGRAIERTLLMDDLRSARAIYVGNALRGLQRVTLAPPA